MIPLKKSSGSRQHRAVTTTRCQETAGRGGKADHVADPADDGCFQLRQCGRRLPDAHVSIHRPGNQVGHSRLRQSATGNERQISRRGSIEALGNQLIEQQRQNLVCRKSLRRQRLFDQPQNRFDVLGVAGRLTRQCFEKRHQPRCCTLNQLPELPSGEFNITEKTVGRHRVGRRPVSLR